MHVGVLEGIAAPCRQLAMYPGLSNDRPWDAIVCVFGLYQQATHA